MPQVDFTQPDVLTWSLVAVGTAGVLACSLAWGLGRGYQGLPLIGAAVVVSTALGAAMAVLAWAQLPLALFLAVLMLVVIGPLLLPGADRLRRPTGRCGGCGYDLRASRGECPECGRAIE